MASLYSILFLTHALTLKVYLNVRVSMRDRGGAVYAFALIASVRYVHCLFRVMSSQLFSPQMADYMVS